MSLATDLALLPIASFIMSSHKAVLLDTSVLLYWPSKLEMLQAALTACKKKFYDNVPIKDGF